MRAPMPRLVKDAKSGIWFFRWSLPKLHQKNLSQKTLYMSLQTRDARLAQCLVALLNLRVEAMKKPARRCCLAGLKCGAGEGNRTLV